MAAVTGVLENHLGSQLGVPIVLLRTRGSQPLKNIDGTYVELPALCNGGPRMRFRLEVAPSFSLPQVVPLAVYEYDVLTGVTGSPVRPLVTTRASSHAVKFTGRQRHGDCSNVYKAELWEDWQHMATIK